MEMKPIVARAREILAQPNAWTRGMYARDARGEFVMPDSPDAVCFCALGAVQRAAMEKDTREEMAANAFISLSLEYVENIIAFNDTRLSVIPVLALFDRILEQL